MTMLIGGLGYVTLQMTQKRTLAETSAQNFYYLGRRLMIGTH
jgi:hypothetical protein